MPSRQSSCLWATNIRLFVGMDRIQPLAPSGARIRLFSKEGSSSFLKKTKKLLSVAGGTLDAICKSFLLPFFKKEDLPSFT
jgi:hypothetical protein